jgi:hypothetical protein
MEDQTERKLSRIARRKLSQAARRTAKKRAAKKKLFAKRMKSPAKLKASSEKVAKNLIVKKMTGGKAYGSLSIGQKEKIDKHLATKKGLIAKVAKKLLPGVKKKEKDRIKKVRASSKDVDESVEEKHGVLTLSVNGSQPEVSARLIDGNLKPYTFKTREDAKQHCKKVGGKPFESIATGRFYVEFTKLDGPVSEKVEYKNANEIKKQWKKEYPNDKFTFKKVRAKGNEFLMVLSPKGVELEKYQFVPKTGWSEMNENKEQDENKKELKAMLDIAKMLSDKSPYFKGRGSKKEYIKMLVHKIQKLSESKKKKFMSKMDAYKKVRKETLPKSRPMKSKKSYDRKDFKKGKYD